ncbi:MAG TPA: aminoglycoside phosphotransferase family protein [Streptosporangiaceae bacterium]|nr:aminoglycoside phosphotransferase family protein [Streptosporangiaceae bacterium]
MTADGAATAAADPGSLARELKRPWLSMPASVRARVEHELRGQVVSAITQAGGFSPGVAARLLLAGGDRAFVKAVALETNPDSPAMYRTEAIITASLPPGIAPRLLATFEADGWVVLILEDIDGRLPARPWQPSELDRVLQAVTGLAQALTPAPASVPAPCIAEALDQDFRGWRRLRTARDSGTDLAGLDPWAQRNLARLAELETAWEEAANGGTLAHCDLRSDNLLLTSDHVYVIDWPAACIAQPWFDLVCMLPSIQLDGGPPPEVICAAHPLIQAADPDAVTAVAAALTGYFVDGSRRSPPPGLPTLRAFQRAQGGIGLTWLRLRTGWE